MAPASAKMKVAITPRSKLAIHSFVSMGMPSVDGIPRSSPYSSIAQRGTFAFGGARHREGGLVVLASTIIGFVSRNGLPWSRTAVIPEPSRR